MQLRDRCGRKLESTAKSGALAIGSHFAGRGILASWHYFAVARAAP